MATAFASIRSTGAIGAQRHRCDDLQRLAQVQALDTSPIDRCTYDRTGNRLSHTAGPGAALAYSYANTPAAPVLPTDPAYASYSHRLQAKGGVTRGYDDNGNTVTGAQDLLEAGFDASNRMYSVVNSGVPASARAYGHNHHGQRVWKSGAAGEELTVYDEDGQILEFSLWTPGSNSTLLERTEVVWLDRLPVATIRTTITAGTPSTRIVYLSADHLHTPRLAREAGSGTVWRWNAVMGNPMSGGSNAFGEQAATGVGAAPFNFDLRFPGQRLDAESGLHYNYLRDYEPGTGRYVESDPIGLKGGMNTFAYVDSNPLLWDDSLGLAKTYNPYQECVTKATKKCAGTFEWICGKFGGYEGAGLVTLVERCKSVARETCRVVPDRDARDRREHNASMNDQEKKCKEACPAREMNCSDWLDCIEMQAPPKP